MGSMGEWDYGKDPYFLWLVRAKQAGCVFFPFDICCVLQYSCGQDQVIITIANQAFTCLCSEAGQEVRKNHNIRILA